MITLNLGRRRANGGSGDGCNVYVWRMVMPPSTGIVVPCRYDDAGRQTLTVT
jgi:hypothetical protein